MLLLNSLLVLKLLGLDNDLLVDLLTNPRLINLVDVPLKLRKLLCDLFDRLFLLFLFCRLYEEILILHKSRVYYTFLDLRSIKLPGSGFNGAVPLVIRVLASRALLFLFCIHIDPLSLKN